MSAGSSEVAPALTLRTQVEGDTTTIECTGKLIAGVTGALRDEVKRLIPESKKIVLDLRNLVQLDSMGLGTILSLYVSAKAAGCQLVLMHLSQRIWDIFRITNVWSILEVYGDNIMRMP